MQIQKWAPLACCSRLPWIWGFAVLLAGCGGGGENESWEYGPPRDITITKIALSAATPVAVGGSPVYFDGGVSGGGNGPLRAKWTYESNDGSPGTYTFPIPVWPDVSKRYTVRVKCTDASGQDFKWALDTLDIYVYAPGFTP